ncbi:ArsR family transcriptional regulator [Flexivirga endophytica]|uniref:ArsR family transcriptional regulator n=1 Tax=Flexivirga endophytica TaxID=1849103 RepID=A0A916SY76_9MICO|nr:helix-turn-helix domain-containing protein [Flexivirga endophytica]GGB22510.1 ArsR family transcriptional regulator [Flexivirga endophytica]GHB56463.1 ArsR family transcriptional regulator [Flexivirga endophytica]
MKSYDEQAPDATPELAALADPVRRRLYEFVADQDTPARRDTAADAVGISRTLAAYHLDRLVEAGLLSTSYARPAGQGGPGAGRPAKLYETTQDEVSVTVPPRSYDVLAGVLADAVAADASGGVQTALLAAAEQEGRKAAAEDDDLLATLRARGYEPELVDDEIDLHNCPFHHLAQRHVELVCGLNHSLLRGLLAGRGDDPECARLAPRPGHCCVTIRASAAERTA